MLMDNVVFRTVRRLALSPFHLVLMVLATSLLVCWTSFYVASLVVHFLSANMPNVSTLA